MAFPSIFLSTPSLSTLLPLKASKEEECFVAQSAVSHLRLQDLNTLGTGEWKLEGTETCLWIQEMANRHLERRLKSLVRHEKGTQKVRALFNIANRKFYEM
jgi:hypothetical protein